MFDLTTQDRINELEQCLAMVDELADRPLSKIPPQLERELCNHLECSHFALANSGLSALQAACWAAGAHTHREVVCDGLFPFAIMAIQNVGAVPIVADIQERTLTIDPSSISAALSEDTVAVIGTAHFGTSPGWENISEVLVKTEIAMIEDRAQGFPILCNPATQSRKMIGTYSFQEGKHLSCGQGGGVSCNDHEFDTRIRRYLSLGWYPRSSPGCETDWDSSWMSRSSHCISGRIAPVSAALLIARLRAFLRNRDNYANLVKRAHSLAEECFPDDAVIPGTWRIAVILESPQELERQFNRLQAAGSKVYRCQSPAAITWPALKMPHFRHLPITQSISGRLMLLPVSNTDSCQHEIDSLLRLRRSK